MATYEELQRSPWWTMLQFMSDMTETRLRETATRTQSTKECLLNAEHSYGVPRPRIYLRYHPNDECRRVWTFSTHPLGGWRNDLTDHLYLEIKDDDLFLGWHRFREQYEQQVRELIRCQRETTRYQHLQNMLADIRYHTSLTTIGSFRDLIHKEEEKKKSTSTPQYEEFISLPRCFTSYSPDVLCEAKMIDNDIKRAINKGLKEVRHTIIESKLTEDDLVVLFGIFGYNGYKMWKENKEGGGRDLLFEWDDSNVDVIKKKSANESKIPFEYKEFKLKPDTPFSKFIITEAEKIDEKIKTAFQQGRSEIQHKISTSEVATGDEIQTVVNIFRDNGYRVSESRRVISIHWGKEAQSDTWSQDLVAREQKYLEYIKTHPEVKEGQYVVVIGNGDEIFVRDTYEQAVAETVIKAQGRSRSYIQHWNHSPDYRK